MRSFARKRRLLWAFVVVTMIVAAAGCAIMFWPRARLAAEKTYSNTVLRVITDRDEKLDAARARLGTLTNGAPLPLDNARLRIEKHNRRATLYSGDRAIKTYKIVLGQHPGGHKQKEGDSRTPEGTYHICTRLDRSKFYRFLGLNYPNAADAERGVAEELITPAQQGIIKHAEKRRGAPPWTTPLGGAIGLHGGGTQYDWTAGCIAFDNDAIEEIWVATDYWTPVEIRQ